LILFQSVFGAGCAGRAGRLQRSAIAFKGRDEKFDADVGILNDSFEQYITICAFIELSFEAVAGNSSSDKLNHDEPFGYICFEKYLENTNIASNFSITPLKRDGIVVSGQLVPHTLRKDGLKKDRKDKKDR